MGLEVRGAETQAEVDAAYELAARVFGPDYYTARETKVRLRAIDPLRSFGEAIVAVSDGDVVAFVRLVARTVTLGGVALPVGGATSVCVRPDFQGQGYGRVVMEEALAASRRRGDALSIAFARRAVDGFYPRLGYLGLGCHPEMRMADAPPRTSDLQLRPGFDLALAEMYADAYRHAYGELPLAFTRDAAWWANFSTRFAHRLGRDDFSTIVRDDVPVAYVVAPAGRVVEAACVEGAYDALLSGISALAASGGLTLALPPAHEIVTSLRRFNHTLSIRQAWDGGHVVRVLDALRFVAALRGVSPAASALAVADASDHVAARTLLERVAGCHGAAPLLPMLPAWSMVDEF